MANSNLTDEDRLERLRKAELSGRVLNHWGAISKDFPGQIEAWQFLTEMLNVELADLKKGMKAQLPQ